MFVFDRCQWCMVGIACGVTMSDNTYWLSIHTATRKRRPSYSS